MDTKECRARSCDTLNIPAQESQSNLQVFTPMIKQEIVVHLDEERPQCIDEEEIFCNNYMNLCKPLQRSDCVDYSDGKSFMLEKVKKEFPEDECFQEDHNRSSILSYENKEYLQVAEKQEHSEVNLSLIKNEEIEDEKYPFLVKIENPEEYRVLDNSGDSSVHYDVLVTPQQVQCKMCSKTFNNRYTLLIHNNEHIKVVLYPTPVNNEMNELHEYNYYNRYFNSHDNVVECLPDVQAHTSELYQEVTEPYFTGPNSEKLEYKCNFCERFYKSRTTLVEHTKKVHIDYGRTFECWCGKQFRTPIHLSIHKRLQHDPNVKVRNNKEFECESCHKLFRTKWFLTRHVNSVHHDYGKTFDCPCGKQFRTPYHLTQHQKRQHGPTDKMSNNEQFKCDSCHKTFNAKVLLTRHVKRKHYDYGKTFDCSCGKQFRTPLYLSIHKKRQHNLKVKNIRKQEFQCNSCHHFYKTKVLLIRHIQRIHYDYGKTFECWCGKQFRTPIHLYQHNQRMHCADARNTNN